VQYNPAFAMLLTMLRSFLGSFVLALLLLPGGIFAQTGPDAAVLKEKVNALVAAFPALAPGRLGFQFIDAENGTVLAEQNAAQFFTPASNTKLYTTALALVRLGQTYRFQTVVRTSRPLANGETAVPDLTLVGGGDPNLSGRILPFAQNAIDNDPLTAIRQLADQIQSHRIQWVAGDIIGDDSRYPYDPYPDGWTVDDTLWYYGAPVSALVVNDNSIHVTVRPTEVGELASVELKPEIGHLILLNEAATEESSTTKIAFSRLPGSNELVISGTIGRSAPVVEEDVAITDPALFAAQALRSALEERGITISGETRALHRELSSVGDTLRAPRLVSSSEDAPLATLDSAPLAQIIQVINKTSQNLHAEILLRETAWATRNLGTLAAGLDERKEFLTGIGIPESAFAFADGSGLARQGLVTPAATAALLEWMWKRPEREVWLASLPIGGIDGTLRNRFKTLAGAERIHAKTGSLSHISALSGYLQTKTGRWITFSLLANAEVNASAALQAFTEQLCAIFLDL
jgi:serine-type D-Ala-D-Ala carboxypeptidase/endopeptidase (penicillin-binding protein 4)